MRSGLGRIGKPWSVAVCSNAAVKSGELPAIRVGTRARSPSKSMRRALQPAADPAPEGQ